MKSLFEIQAEAKKDPALAAGEILKFLEKKFPDLNAKKVKINQSTVSLNSVNGFIETESSKKFFFKFHAEEGEEISMDEYYNSQILEESGLPIISPIFKSTNPGEQFLIYEKIEVPTFFDVLEEQDALFLEKGHYDEEKRNKILEAEVKLCQKVFSVYKKTLHLASSDDLEKESINQLFFRRLHQEKETPRVSLFYENKDLELPRGEKINTEDLKDMKWIINREKMDDSLNDLIEKAIKILNPLASDKSPAVTGHGDDHNGNKFAFETREGIELKFFDPAFAGLHQHALLSFIKSTFHDVFAHPFWLYDSPKVKPKLNYEIKNKEVHLDFDWGFAEKAPIRKEILDIKIKEVWQPLISLLKEKDLLSGNYLEYTRLALFCCPFLVFNLTDPGKYPEEKSLLALAKALEIGNRGMGG